MQFSGIGLGTSDLICEPYRVFKCAMLSTIQVDLWRKAKICLRQTALAVMKTDNSAKWLVFSIPITGLLFIALRSLSFWSKENDPPITLVFIFESTDFTVNICCLTIIPYKLINRQDFHYSSIFRRQLWTN